MKSSRLAALRLRLGKRNPGMYRENYGNGKNGREKQLVWKALLCVIGIVVLFFIAFSYQNHRLKEDNAPYVPVKEVLPVLEAFMQVNAGSAAMDVNKEDVTELIGHFLSEQNMEERYLTLGELQVILEAFPLEIKDLAKEYKSVEWPVGTSDWNEIVELLVKNYGGNQIVLREEILLGTAEHVFDETGTAIGETAVLTKQGTVTNRYWNIRSYLLANVKAVCYGDLILTITGYAKDDGVLENVYVSDVSNGKMHIFYKGFHILYPPELIGSSTGKYQEGETLRIIADMRFDKGKAEIEREKEEYIHGKLLQVGDTSMEVEGYGSLSLDENMQVYKVYGQLASMAKNNLRIGYSFYDFVVEDGKIVACLMIKEEDMDYIRVLIKNSDMAERNHEEVIGYCNQDCEWIEYEDGVEKNREVISKGERFKISKDDIQRTGKRIKIVPSVLSGQITLESVRRSNGNPSYLGSLEITGEEEGLIVINEVLLEDYLCKVVPSEMPSSYPKEALMAQAVCARTYAYSKMLQAGLPQYGAHVDDSAGFQVYNNIAEQVSTTEAVKATHNTIAVYNGEPIGTYYYSTSCGMGSDTGVWHGSAETPPYLQAKEIGATSASSGNDVVFTDAEFTPQGLMQEEIFKKWITDVKDSHYESKEGWYRWSYQVNKMDVSHFEEVLKARYAVNPNLVLTKEDKEFVSREIEDLGDITDIKIVKRLSGGVADELLITGTKASIKVISELNIRSVLSDGITKVMRQTNDEADAASTLPSAFIYLETIKEDDEVTGYTITGGGFGHGVGMSQNGAKNMAEAGMSCEEILTFFYPGITLKTLEFEGDS